MHVSVIRHGVDLLAREDLDVFPAGSAVKLVGPNESPAHTVRHFTLLTHMLCKIRRGLNGYLSEIK